jgi:hypothetical protein
MAIIRLTTCNNSIEANLIKGMLDTNGIRCVVTNEHFSNLMPFYNGLMGAGAQVMIEDIDLKKSQELLLSSSKDTGIHCPNCNFSDIYFGLGNNKVKKILFVLISLLSWIPFANIKNTYYCRDCGTEFKL